MQVKDILNIKNYCRNQNKVLSLYQTIKKNVMAKVKFSFDENRLLTEAYRRLNYFHNGNLKYDVLCEIPSRAKTLISIGIIEPSYSETPRHYNWYKLTDVGKKFFKNYIVKISEKENIELFNGEVMKFDYNYYKKVLQKSK